MSRFRSFLLALVVGICLAPSRSGWAGGPASPEKALVPSAIRSYVLPLSFEANRGQVDQQVKYLARGQGYTLFLTPGAAVLGLRSEGAGNPTAWLRLVLQGAAPAPAITGEEVLSGKSHYFVIPVCDEHDGNLRGAQLCEPAKLGQASVHFVPGARETQLLARTQVTPAVSKSIAKSFFMVSRDRTAVRTCRPTLVIAPV